MVRTLPLAFAFSLSGCVPHTVVPSSLREPGAEARRPPCKPAVTLSRLSTKPQDALKDIDRVSGIATTPVKKAGISGWSDTGCTAEAEGVLVREAAHSTEGFWTVDVRLERFEIDKVQASPGRFLRIEVAPGTTAHDVTSAKTADEDQAAKASRDPVAPARRSDAAMKKACSHTLDDGSPVHSWHSLMAELSTIVRNTCRAPNGADDAPTFQITTTPNPKQKRALDLIDQIKM